MTAMKRNQPNPLHQPPVLEILFQYMDVQSLKVARRVCPGWKEVSSRELGNKSVVTISNLRFYDKYKRLSSFPVRNLCVNDVSYFHHEMFKNVGHSLTSLHFPLKIGAVTGDGNYKCCPFQWSTIHSILLCCENLKEFSVSLSICQECSPLPVPTQYRNNENGRGNIARFCEESYENITTLKISLEHNANLASLFVKRMPCISSLDISVGGQIYLDTIMDELENLRHQKYLKNLHKVRIQGNKNGKVRFGDRHLSNLISMKLIGLKSLEIKEIAFRNPSVNRNAETQLSPSLFYELFMQCSNTLQVFSLNNGKTNQLPIFKFPVMQKLTYLEIYLLLLPDWPRLLLRTNILEQFPNIKKIVVCQRYCKLSALIGREAIDGGLDNWSTFNLECKRNSGSKMSNGVHEFHLRLHNLVFSTKHLFLFEEMRNFFPTLRSIRTTITGYNTLLSLMTVMRWTLVEEMDITVLCNQRFCSQTSSYSCHCCYDKIAVVTGLDAYVFRFKKDIKNFQELVGNIQFSKLQKLSIKSGGCETMDHAVSFPNPMLENFLTDAKGLDLQLTRTEQNKNQILCCKKCI